MVSLVELGNHMNTLLNATFKSIKSARSKSLCFPILRFVFSEFGRKFLLLAMVTAPMFARSSSIEDAFNESIYSEESARGSLLHVRDAVKAYCAAISGPSVSEAVACEWPELSTRALERLTQLNEKAQKRFARSARLALPTIDPVDRLENGNESTVRNTAQVLDFLQLAQRLGSVSRALIQNVQSPSWIVTNSQYLDLPNANDVASEVARFQAHIQSENPVGYLRVLASLLPIHEPELNQFTACLQEPADIQAIVHNDRGLYARERLLFKEVDIARSAWGHPVAGILQTDEIVKDPQRLIAQLSEYIAEHDLSRIGTSLDECRALDWALDVFQVSIRDLQTVRLACEIAKTGRRALHLNLNLDPKISFAAKVILLLETQRERGSKNSVAARRATSVLRDLQLQTSSKTQCPENMKSLAKPIIQQLRQFIRAQPLEEQ